MGADPVKILGRFIGETSCGFVKGAVYDLVISTDTKNYFVWVKDKNGSGVCPYSSIRALAENWEIPCR